MDNCIYPTQSCKHIALTAKGRFSISDRPAEDRSLMRVRVTAMCDTNRGVNRVTSGEEEPTAFFFAAPPNAFWWDDWQLTDFFGYKRCFCRKKQQYHWLRVPPAKWISTEGPAIWKNMLWRGLRFILIYSESNWVVQEMDDEKLKKKKGRLHLNCCQSSMLSSGSTVVDWSALEKKRSAIFDNLSLSFTTKGWPLFILPWSLCPFLFLQPVLQTSGAWGSKEAGGAEG